MDPTIGLTATTIACGVGGFLGSLLRASVNKMQPTLSKQTLVDVVVGGLVGLIIPAVDPWPEGWTVIWKGASVAVVSYVSSDLVTNLMQRFIPGLNLIDRDRRATDVKDVSKPTP